jgi:hypothetical protein
MIVEARAVSALHGALELAVERRRRPDLEVLEHMNPLIGRTNGKNQA